MVCVRDGLIVDSDSLSYLGQTFVLPISLSAENDMNIALVTAAIPSAMFLLGNELVFKPRRRAELLAYVCLFAPSYQVPDHL